jgi:hypothetical protein
MARRNTQVELCFDSMTDLICNLAGGLILIVLLLLGLPGGSPSTAPASEAEEVKVEGPQSMEPLLRQINEIRAEIRGVDKELESMERDWIKLKEKVAAKIAPNAG